MHDSRARSIRIAVALTAWVALGGCTGARSRSAGAATGEDGQATTSRADDAEHDTGADADDEVTADSALVLEIAPGTVRQGDAVMITVHGSASDGTAWKTDADCPDLLLGERKLQFFVTSSGSCRALLGLTVEQPPGRLPIQTSTAGEAGEAEGAREILGELEVVEAKFNVRELTVAKKFVAPPPSVRKRMKADQKAFKRAYAQAFVPPTFSANFTWPMSTVITAPFGDLRTFNGKKSSQHYGTDLDGDVGDPIAASNDGRVVMSRENYAAGNTVVLHHGADIYTAYFHLSKIEVKEGQAVRQGERIGLVGSTGRVTGPHLHFSVRVGGMYVDPQSVLRLDFTR